MTTTTTTTPARVESMTCPVCRDEAATLVPHELTAHLPSRRCPRCGGQWVRGEQYFLWLERAAKAEAEPTDAAPADAPANDNGEPPAAAADSTRAKLCPECGRLLRRHAVGHGLDFGIDRCGTCAGIWLDAAEFEALRSRGLHDKIHFVFSAAWQADLARQRQAAAHEQLLRAKLGDADFDEARRIKSWLDAHPRRAELYAFLMGDGLVPPAVGSV